MITAELTRKIASYEIALSMRIAELKRFPELGVSLRESMIWTVITICFS